MLTLRRVATSFFAGAIVFAAAGFEGKSFGQAPSPAKLTVGVGISAGTFGPWIVAKEKGFAEKNGIDLTVRVFDQGASALEGLLAGQLDMTSPSLATVIPPGSKGVGVVLGMIGSTRDIFGAVARKEISSASDLTKAGIVIGRPEGTSPYFLSQYLKANNIDASKITVRNVDVASLLPALTRGDIHAFFAFEPHVRTALGSVPGTRVLARGGDVGFVDSTTLIVSGKLASDERTSAALMKALIESTTWMRANQQQSAEIIAKFFKIPLHDVTRDLSIYDYKVTLRKATVDQMKDIANWLLSQGRIKQLPEWSSFINPSPLKSVAPDAVDF